MTIDPNRTQRDRARRDGAFMIPERRRATVLPALEGAGVWLVIPCYRVKAHILSVLAKTPAWVSKPPPKTATKR